MKVYIKHGYDLLEPLTKLRNEVQLIQKASSDKITLVLPAGFRAGEDLNIYAINRDVNGFCIINDNTQAHTLEIKDFPEGKKTVFALEKVEIKNFEKCKNMFKLKYNITQKITKAREYELTPSFVTETSMKLKVFPNNIDTSKIQATKPDDSIPAGSLIQIKLQGNDQYGNKVNLFEAVEKFNMKFYKDKEKKEEIKAQVEKSIYQEDSILFSIIINVTGVHYIGLTYDGKGFENQNLVYVNIIPGECIYSNDPSLISLKSDQMIQIGDVIKFEIICKDKFQNVVVNKGDADFKIEVSRVNVNFTDNYEIKTDFDSDAKKFIGTSKIIYEGNYTALIKLNTNGKYYGKEDGIVFKVTIPSCPEDKPYLCPNMTCTDNIAVCDVYYNQAEHPCDEANRKEGKFYYNSVTKTCVNVDNLEVPQGYQRCNGTIIPATSICGKRVSTCYTTLKGLYGSSKVINMCDDGSCRINQDCPISKIGCAIGYRPCGYKCIKFNEQCKIDICAEGLVTCWDQSCATKIEECPTKMSCVNETDYLCPDGKCVEDRYMCLPPPKCQQDEYLCNDNTCKKNKEDCVKQKVCPMGQSLCQNGKCSEDCNEKEVCPNGEILCPNGLCAKSISQCASDMYCPKGTIKCPKGGCAKTVEGCKYVQDNRVISCPASKPYLCPNFLCTDNATLCESEKFPDCPESAPFLCWNNECRKSESQCPSKIVCPASHPVLCNDLSCEKGTHHCRILEESDNIPSYFRCADGSYLPSQSYCPSFVSCPKGTVRCASGSCVNSVDECPKRTECNNPEFPYRCPDETCRPNRDSCSSVSTCPLKKPVKCYDTSCRTTFEACPQYQQCKENQVSCPDGTCAEGYEKCNTIVSCVRSSRYLCPDLKCVTKPDLCKEHDDCLNKFLCYSGNCVSNRLTCKSFDSCNTDYPIKCSSNSCDKNIDECTKLISRNCPNGYVECEDGECKISDIYCNKFECPANKPYLCPEGVCERGKEYCDIQDNGCPYNRKYR